MYTMKQVADKMNLSVHTLRFYANEGLFPHLERDYNNIRLFSEKDIEWVKLVQCLRDTNMPLADIKKYIELCEDGECTLEQRYAMIAAQKEKALAELEEMKKRIELLNWKSNYYKECIEGKNDRCNPAANQQEVKIG